jgi:3',5'-cyclic AMP phosphodiesterase CpdA
MRPKPSLLLVTGDLVERGDDPKAYRHMVALMARWEGPIIWTVGNHDRRAGFRAVLPQVPVDENGFIQYEMDHGGVRWLVLDTLDEGRHGGMICEQRAAWLKKRLREREAWVQRLEEVVRPAKQVVGMIAGHVHRPIATSFAGKQLTVCCSAAPWLALDLEDIDPTSPDGRSLIIGDPPAYALHYWNGERLLTHFDAAGPHPVLASYDSNAQPMIRDFLEERGTG